MADPLNRTTLIGDQATAFRGFSALLRANRTLKLSATSWADFNGKAKSASDLEYSLQQMPAISLLPEAEKAERLTIGANSHRDISLIVTIEIATAGNNWDDSARLWNAVETLVSSDDFLTDIEVFGVWDVEIISPATAVNVGDPFAVATGKIRLLIST